jgi:protein ImuB
VWLLVATTRGVQWVAGCCARGAALAVRVGMRLAHARALIHGAPVRLVTYDPGRDAHRLHALARWALRFCPVVAVDPPDGLLLDIAGCARLYRGEKPHVRAIADGLARLGFTYRIVVAPTFGGARAVARCAESGPVSIDADQLPAALAPLPVTVLRLSPVICETLAEMGVERIEQLRALPRDALATRFGAEVAVELDRALGHAEETIEPIRPAVSFEVVREFDGPVVSSEAIIAAVRQLLSELAAMLAARQLGARAVRVTLRRVRAESVGLRCALTCPNHDEAHWWTLLRPRLERVQLGYGVEEIQIRAARPTRVRPTQLTLWPDVGGESAGGLARALGTWMDQVLDRWGAESVARIAPVASYVPERAFRVVPCGERAANAQRASANQAPVDGTSQPVARPSRLLEVAEQVRVIAPAPEGPPAWLRWRGEEYAIVTGVGPERITLPWWEGGDAGARDYFQVQTECGRWLWVFRNGVSGAWYVHGEWA